MRACLATGALALAGALFVGSAIATADRTAPPPQSMFVAAPLTGGQVVPGPGDPDGKGVLGLNPGGGNHKICWGLAVKRLDTVTGAYVLDGAPGEAGPPLLTLFEDPAGRPGKGVYRGCVRKLEPRLVRQVFGFGRNHRRDWSTHIEVRTSTHPAGALRGRLAMGVPTESLPSR